MGIKELLKRWQGQDKFDAQERRKFARLVYSSLKRPRFKVGDHYMELVDISEKGIKFVKDEQTKISECVSGNVELLSGELMDITGKIVWEHGDEVGLLITRIPESVIVDEIRALLRELGPEGNDEEK